MPETRTILSEIAITILRLRAENVSALLQSAADRGQRGPIGRASKRGGWLLPVQRSPRAIA
jgi:hypothetical protein